MGRKPTAYEPALSNNGSGRAFIQRKPHYRSLGVQGEYLHGHKTNDVTNLQHTSPDAVDRGRGGGSEQTEQSTGSLSASTFNPSAPPFRPSPAAPVADSAKSHFTPYQPLRVSTGQTETQILQQASSSSGKANTNSRKQNGLQSRGLTTRMATQSNVPFPSVEEQSRQMSNTPVTSRPFYNLRSLDRRSPRQSTRSPTPPPAPVATPAYLARAASHPVPLAAPQKLLVVVDLNGTLLKRAQSRGTNFVLRPGVENLMDYLFANHIVMIYTSSRPTNAAGMVEKLLNPTQRSQLAAVWARDKLDLTSAQYYGKVQVYKRLEKIWNDTGIQQYAGTGRRWDQTNTVLVDDSHLKALAQPYNLLQVEEFLNDRPLKIGAKHGKSKDPTHVAALDAWIATQHKIVRDLEGQLEGLKWTQDVSSLIRKWQLASKEAEGSIEGNDKIVEETQKEITQLLTPKNPVAVDPAVSESDHSDGGARTKSRPDHEMDELTNRIERQHVDDEAQDGSRGKSVSPIDEDVWKDILNSVERA